MFSNGLFIFIFLIGLAKRTWSRNKSSIIIKGLEAMLVSKKTEIITLSRAQRTASKTILIKYTHQEQEYEVILPMRRRPLGWTFCKATMKDGTVCDITAEIKEKAGPHKDFFGVTLKPGQIHRNAIKLEFMSPKKAKPVLVIE